MALEVDRGEVLVGDDQLFGVGPLVEAGETFRPVRVEVAAIRLMITSWLIRGLPRQFCEMKLNRRCSILFHLLVPGEKWQTWIESPVSSARRCSSAFHRRRRFPFEPPQSAVIVSVVACG